ncbi:MULTISPECIES: TonB-dependent receptor [unclassified Flavobacterium]|uniref:TonB-dependent receptor n=1 Tax=unclassified Flavobacterium TaxID=196869 RepID=UPI001291A184|nr:MULTISPECIES: TonB-dependent receptor [unclassified Flavobacterium]MQP51218.1 TonB-dependent receptor [Flavobacterium sp. LMO9]MQP61553.1 TonB-dependent receptor [Flavobacterium sp. LMO6]
MKTLLKQSTRYKVQSTKAYLSLFFIFFSLFSFSQEKPKDSLKTTELKEVTVSSVRAKDKNPITYTNLSKEDIAPRNLGQDVPVLLQYLPSVVSTTDAGNGLGYTYMRVRGADGSRINVTLNGVPFNDSESQGTFFVNLPDFASSLESVQLQRGVGTSTNGAGAFGASLNMQTKSFQEKAYAEVSNSVGSFATRKHTIAFGTGLHNNFEMNARISNVASDGFIDRATSNMFGYFFNTNYITEQSQVKFLAFGGKQKTYQAWYGIEDTEKLKNDRTFNPAGMYTDEFGNVQFYDNETDNYWQNHFQLHWTEKWSEKWISNAALHYTIGKGYFEQYKEDEDLTDYNLPDFNGNSISDLVRKRWLDNDFFGATFSLNYRTPKTDLLFGGAANRYLGKHFGEVVWTQNYVPNPNRYYDNFGNKDDVNFYTKASYNITSHLNLFADLQYRMVFYEATSVKFSDVNDTFRFFNPKAGVNYQLDTKNSFYGFLGVANKEPRRDDYESGSVKPERLIDYELGWKYNTQKVKISANAFYMNYKDQLVLTGALNDVGSPIFTNSGKSYRVGLEVESTIAIADKLILNPNVTLSQNKNQDFYFQRDGVLQNLGNTDIAFSPNLIVGNRLTFLPIKDFQISLLSKFVSEQYMGNIDSKRSKLEAYFVNDLNINYEWKINKSIKSIVLSGLVNNIFDLEYESNGYFYTYDDDWSSPGNITTIEGAGYFPQAGINFILGLNLKF